MPGTLHQVDRSPLSKVNTHLRRDRTARGIPVEAARVSANIRLRPVHIDHRAIGGDFHLLGQREDAVAWNPETIHTCAGRTIATSDINPSCVSRITGNERGLTSAREEDADLLIGQTGNA